MNRLGMSSGSSCKARFLWNPILEKMKGRLPGWKRLHLSPRGIKTLKEHNFLPTLLLPLAVCHPYFCGKWIGEIREELFVVWSE